MRSGKRHAVAGVVALAALLSSCTSSPAGTLAEPWPSLDVQVDVDTPQLRAQKKKAGVQPCEPGTATAQPGGMPDLTLPCLGGGPDVNLATVQGPVVLNLFAQWCGPCRVELPFYQRLHEAAAGRLTVLGVDYLDTQPGRALELVQEAGVTYPLLADPGSRLHAPFRVRGLPVLVLVDETGRVAYRQAVAVDSYAQLKGLVEKHLDIRL